MRPGELPRRSAKLLDVLTAAPLIVWYGFAVAGMAMSSYRSLVGPASGPDWRSVLDLASRMLTTVFLGVQVILFLIRKLPIARASGVAPRAAGLAGATVAFALLALPRVTLPPAVLALSLSLVAISTLGSIVSAIALGRGFSILPQARRFVTVGPYRLIRHPIYFFEQVGNFALMLQYLQPWSLLVALASLAAQFPRMHYEEQILRRTFPEYASYCVRTWRILPGIY